MHCGSRAAARRSFNLISLPPPPPPHPVCVCFTFCHSGWSLHPAARRPTPQITRCLPPFPPPPPRRSITECTSPPALCRKPPHLSPHSWPPRMFISAPCYWHAALLLLLLLHLLLLLPHRLYTVPRGEGPLCGTGIMQSVDKVALRSIHRPKCPDKAENTQSTYFFSHQQRPGQLSVNCRCRKESGVTAAVAILLLLSSFPVRAATLHN